MSYSSFPLEGVDSMCLKNKSRKGFSVARKKLDLGNKIKEKEMSYCLRKEL